MTKKHFEALAKALQREKPVSKAGADVFMQWQEDLRAVAQVCLSFNSRFSVTKFYAAVGLED